MPSDKIPGVCSSTTNAGFATPHAEQPHKKQKTHDVDSKIAAIAPIELPKFSWKEIDPILHQEFRDLAEDKNGLPYLVALDQAHSTEGKVTKWYDAQSLNKWLSQGGGNPIPGLSSYNIDYYTTNADDSETVTLTNVGSRWDYEHTESKLYTYLHTLFDANAGNLSAQFKMALIYFKGHNPYPKKDLLECKRYLKIVAEEEIPEFNEQSLDFLDGIKPPSTEYELVEKLAEMGFSEALFLQGIHLYQEGKSVQDLERAHQCFQNAAEKEHLGAQYYQSLNLLHGIGTHRDEAKAVTLLKELDKDNPIVKLLRAYCYCYGLGGKAEDSMKAFALLDKLSNPLAQQLHTHLSLRDSLEPQNDQLEYIKQNYESIAFKHYLAKALSFKDLDFMRKQYPQIRDGESENFYRTQYLRCVEKLSLAEIKQLADYLQNGRFVMQDEAEAARLLGIYNNSAQSNSSNREI